MQLNLTAAQKPQQTDRTVERRAKLALRIDQQIAKLDEVSNGKTVKGTWYWQAEDGSYLLSIRYGRRDLELSKGMFSIACEDTPAIQASLVKVREMVLSGDLDDALEKASVALRAKFKKAK